MPESSKEHRGFVLGFEQMLLVDCFRDQRHSLLSAKHFEVGSDWDDCEVVLRLPKDTPKLFGNSNDFERRPIHLDCFSDRIPV